MKPTIRSLIGGGAKLLLPLLFVNAAIADSTTDARIQAYKANKLIPQNIVLPTSTGAADSDEVVVFNKNALTWKSDSANNVTLNALSSKYGDWSAQDFDNAFGPAGHHGWDGEEYADGYIYGILPEGINKDAIDEMRAYLGAIANGKLTSDKLSASEARAELQEQLDTLCNNMVDGDIGIYLGAFPCDGLNFSGKSLRYVDTTKLVGLTGEQVASLRSIDGCTLPAVSFSGTEDFSHLNLYNADISNCTGITAEQVLASARYGYDGTGITWATLPAIEFSGAEDLSDLSLAYTDLRKCTGITVDQLLSVKSLEGASLPAVTFNGNENLSGLGLSYTDFSLCEGISGTQWLNYLRDTYCYTRGVTFTGQEDCSNVNFAGTYLGEINGITANQILQVQDVASMEISSAQYNEWKSALSRKHKGKTIYVDGEQIVIP